MTNKFNLKKFELHNLHYFTPGYNIFLSPPRQGFNDVTPIILYYSRKNVLTLYTPYFKITVCANTMSTECVHPGTHCMISWHSPQQESRKPPLTEGTNIFFFLQYNHHEEDTPSYYTTTLKIKKCCTLPSFWRIYVKICSIFHMCTTKPSLTEGVIFLVEFFRHHHCQKDTSWQYISVEFNFKFCMWHTFF